MCQARGAGLVGTADQALVPMYRLSGEDLQFVHFNVEHRNEAVCGGCARHIKLSRKFGDGASTQQMTRLAGMQCSWKRSQ